VDQLNCNSSGVNASGSDGYLIPPCCVRLASNPPRLRPSGSAHFPKRTLVTESAMENEHNNHHTEPMVGNTTTATANPQSEGSSVETSNSIEEREKPNGFAVNVETESSGHSTSTQPVGRPWRATLLRFGPLSGILYMGIAITSVLASMAILIAVSTLFCLTPPLHLLMISTVQWGART
jgi:hypothetical protein